MKRTMKSKLICKLVNQHGALTPQLPQLQNAPPIPENEDDIADASMKSNRDIKDMLEHTNVFRICRIMGCRILQIFFLFQRTPSVRRSQHLTKTRSCILQDQAREVKESVVLQPR